MKILLLALLLTAVTVLIHGLGTFRLSARLLRRWQTRQGRELRSGRLVGELQIVQLVSLLLGLHLSEAAVWAVFYCVSGLLPDPETAAYYSLTSYTTVGYGDVVLDGAWRILGPIESAVGVLMLGWSTGLLVAVLTVIFQGRTRGESAAGGDETNPKTKG